jgi:hypothetical protein
MKYLISFNESFNDIDEQWIKNLKDINLSKIEKMIKNGYDINKIIDGLLIRNTALNYAAFFKYDNLIKLLLKYDARLDIIISNNNTTLLMTSFNITKNNYQALKLILEKTPKELLFHENNLNKTFISYLEKDILDLFKKDYPEIYKNYEKYEKSKKFNI